MTEDKVLEFDFGVYYGEVSTATGLRHGWGILEYHNGNSYEGRWENGAPNGEGTKRFRNGDYHVGDWVNGKRHGSGTYYHVQGDIFTGEYVDDQCHGKGKLVTRNGDVFEGEWVRGKKHGEGVERLANGNTFQGTWRNGRKEGNGVFTTPTERVVGVWEGDRVVQVISRQEMEYQPQVRPMVTSAMSTEDGQGDAESILIGQNALEDMRRAGADPALVQALSAFSEDMSERMGTLMGGIGSLEAQLESLTGALESLAGLEDGDELEVDENGSHGSEDDEDDGD